MGSLWQDLRYSLRMIAKAPGFAAIAILTLALGIGANTTIFSWINSALLNPVPGVTRADSVVALTIDKPGEDPFGFPYPDIQFLQEQQKSFTGITACMFSAMSLTGKGKGDRAWGMVTTANYFDVLGVRPILGRGFLPADDQKPGGAPETVISYRLWQTRFGADPNIVGKTIDINEHPYDIVGVAPAAFQGSQTGVRVDLWVPIMMTPQVMAKANLLNDHANFWLLAFGRLKPGVRLEQAQEEMTLLLKRQAKSYPEEHRGKDSVIVYPLWRNPFGLNHFFAFLLPLLMAIAGVVLLLACTNVANLMLVRSVGRRREIAIRMSLGASRWRLVRQLLLESLLLALAGGGVALLITFWTAGTLMKFLPVGSDIPLSLDVRTDRMVLFATLVISILTGLIFGILPALRSSSIAPLAVLKEETGSASSGVRKARLTGVLVVAQISLSLLLLICAGLFIRSVWSAGQISRGFNPHNVLMGSYDLFTAGYSDSTGMEFDRQLVAKLAALPGVETVALTSRLPLVFESESTSVKPEGYVPQPNESMETQDAAVTPNYFRTLQIPIVKGRDFTLEDNMKSQRVAIVSEAFAARYWPRQEALGNQFDEDLTNERVTVVGVARDSKISSLNEKPTPIVYLPLYQIYHADTNIAVRVAGDPLVAVKTISNAIHELNADLVLFDMNSLESSEEIASFGQRIAGTFVGAFGLLALVLATVGIYGVTAYTTRQRTHEIGIRVTLGASKKDVLRLVLGYGLKLMLAGVVVGLVMSLFLTRFLRSLLLGVTSTDAVTFLSVVVLLCGVAMFACFLPARRATRVDPMVALRYQ
jgi:predicted permease